MMDTSLRQLAINESHAMTVNPRLLHVPTGLIVSAGQVYTFAAVGQWKDCRRVCGPKGWNGRCLQRFNRLPGKPFFLLCGSVGQVDNTAFAIGDRLEWRVPDDTFTQRDRQLYLFANDWRFMYLNNHELDASQGGPMRVSIVRTQ